MRNTGQHFVVNNARPRRRKTNQRGRPRRGALYFAGLHLKEGSNGGDWMMESGPFRRLSVKVRQNARKRPGANDPDALMVLTQVRGQGSLCLGLWLKEGDGEKWMEGDFGNELRITVRRKKNTKRTTGEPDYEVLLNRRRGRGR